LETTRGLFLAEDIFLGEKVFPFFSERADILTIQGACKKLSRWQTIFNQVVEGFDLQMDILIEKDGRKKVTSTY
jgi:hypothetical protein